MKTINVSDEIYAGLFELATEMTTQNPRGTKMPHMFQIRDWKRVYDWGLNGDTKVWIDPDMDHCVIETHRDLIDYLHNISYFDVKYPSSDSFIDKDRMNHEINELFVLWTDDFDFGLPDWIEENCPSLKECTYSMQPEYTNSFLTAKAAENHLKLNHYHYHEDADVYLNHAWRNPEADLVSEFLCNLVDKKLHT
jgi:hypothetical protein